MREESTHKHLECYNLAGLNDAEWCVCMHHDKKKKEKEKENKKRSH